MTYVEALIDRAAKKVGSRYKLAQLMKVGTPSIYNWETGRKQCPAEERARIAGYAGEDAVQELVRATIEQAKGEVKKEQLEKLLGKLLRQTGGALHTVVALVASLTFLMIAAGHDLLHTMYRSVKLKLMVPSIRITPKSPHMRAFLLCG